jgi:hypothetical protein
MTRFVLAIATCTTLTGCALTRFQTSVGPPQPWPPATGTVIAQTEYGRITRLDDGGYSIELRETPIPPDRPEADHAAAMEAIRAFADAPDLELTYKELQRHPENTGIIVEVYDSPDAQFMIDIASEQVVYMQALVVPPSRPGSVTIPPRELQDRMTEFVSTKNPCFDNVVDQLVLEPGDKRDVHFFRWHSPTPDTERPWNQPTFVQVGVDNYGIVFGYVDSGICYLEKP